MLQYFPVNYLIQELFPELYFQTVYETPVEPTPGPVIPEEDISTYDIILFPSVIRNQLSATSRIRNIIVKHSIVHEYTISDNSHISIITIPSRIKTILDKESIITHTINGKSSIGDIRGESMLKLDITNGSFIERSS